MKLLMKFLCSSLTTIRAHLSGFNRKDFRVNSWAQCCKNFLRPLSKNGPNKLQCVSLVGLSRLVQCLYIKQGAYPIGGAPERFFNRVGSCCTNRHQTKLERLAMYKHSSLLQTLVNYGRKKFYNIGPWTQCCKTFIRPLSKNGRK